MHKIWVEFALTAATSVHRGMVLSHPSTHSSLLDLVRQVIGDICFISAVK
ncbi:MAG: hypothetical protein KME28_13005 [Pelatocladus maniniholoensis HA4357-MV3]|uniref:Uncharacterized protein n=1 Tax=Pelatocladus maniniholoensis HA4357-MV3 TaxID=1117104 RepID=A0A9E3H8I2_9NOST|nr:hypothetical protein [Pelatocladus maniniholoensis HA4357-MV3]